MPTHAESRVVEKFPVQSDSGYVRTIVCAQDHNEMGGQHGTPKYYVAVGRKNYCFEDGEPAAMIEDAFLDRSGEIYRRFPQ